MELSRYQSEILQAVENRLSAEEKKGLIVEARAGSGKSTMVWLICQKLKEKGYTPSQVAALVFGRKNKEDLQRKVHQKVGTSWAVVVQTLHSLCYGIYRKALNVKHTSVKMEGKKKYNRIAQKFGFFPSVDQFGRISKPGSLLESKAIYAEKDFSDLIDQLRLYCLDATPENVQRLVDIYQLNINDIGLLACAANQCLNYGLSEATKFHIIDMTDMVWVPWAKRDDSRFSAAIENKRAELRFLMLDEAQDTDQLQIEMLKLLVDPTQSFITAVGDRNQAVYFFRGCLSNGMEKIAQAFNGENLPLPVCYRCGSRHLELVRQLFPKIPIEPGPNAPPGEIRVITRINFPLIFEDKNLNYMGVCRKNAPLVIAAIQLLSAGLPAKIKDRDIGSRLVARVKDICQKQRVKYDPETFIRVTNEYEHVQRRRLEDFPNSEKLLLDLTDTLEAIRALFRAYSPENYKAWDKIVDQIFDESGYSPISLYTIHSGKGGEGEVSFIIYPEEMPLSHPSAGAEERQQEQHLIYVALTRTLADIKKPGSGILYLVLRDSGSQKVNYPTWLPQQYRKLWKWGEEDQPDQSENNWSYSGVEAQPVRVEVLPPEEPESTVNNENNWSDAPTEETQAVQLDEEDKLKLSELEQQVSTALEVPQRLWYSGGLALRQIRLKRLYRETHLDFHIYCKEKFQKTRRQIDRWIAAATTLDNLIECGFEVLPTAESVLRPIASLSPQEQFDIWDIAVEEADGQCPTAAQVEEAKRDYFGNSSEEEVTALTNSSHSTQTLKQAHSLIESLSLVEMENLYSRLGELIKIKRLDS